MTSNHNNGWLWYIRGVTALLPLVFILQSVIINDIKLDMRDLKKNQESIVANLHTEVVEIKQRLSRLEERLYRR